MHTSNGIEFIIAANLKKARLRHKMSQSVAPQYLGVTYQQLQKYENGANRISAVRLWHLSVFYNIPIQDFFED